MAKAHSRRAGTTVEGVAKALSRRAGTTVEGVAKKHNKRAATTLEGVAIGTTYQQDPLYCTEIRYLYSFSGLHRG